MNRVALLVCVLGTLSAPGRAFAQDAPARLELSLEEAVKRALENNVDLSVERLSPELSILSVKQAEGAWDPLFGSTVLYNNSTTPSGTVLAGADKQESKNTTYNFGVTQPLHSGGSLSLDFNNRRQSTNSSFATLNPQYSATLNLGFRQPLLRNFSVDSNRYQLKVAKKNREISDVTFRQTVVNTVAGVKKAYYDILYAVDNLESARKSLSLAKKLLDENQIKVRVGTLAPLDVVLAESEVASREEGVINAETALQDAEDTIKRAIFPRNDPASWATKVVATDRASADPITIDADGAIAKALENRTDVVALRKSLENSDAAIEFSHGQTKPALDFVAGYGTAGLGGTTVDRTGTNPLATGAASTIISNGGYGDALGDAFGTDYPTWSLGVNFSWTIRNRTAKAQEARARVSRDQAQAALNRLQIQVVTEVRSAARAVEANLKRVASTRAARVLQERRLDAEEKKFAAGMSTNFLVTQGQRDLSVAEVAELRAIADYRKSIVDFERVQEAGLGSSGAAVTLGVVSSVTSRSVSSGPSTGTSGNSF
jgi:HAE1 family hydrophobic/amphiphilic exporter-1